MKKYFIIFYLFSLTIVYMQGMEQDKNILSITPNNVIVGMYNGAYPRDITQTTVYKKYILGTLLAKYVFGFNYKTEGTQSRPYLAKYFEHSNDLEMIVLFCQANITLGKSEESKKRTFILLAMLSMDKQSKILLSFNKSSKRLTSIIIIKKMCLFLILMAL